jgi:hypothetical protein
MPLPPILRFSPNGLVIFKEIKVCDFFMEQSDGGCYNLSDSGSSVMSCDVKRD